MGRVCLAIAVLLCGCGSIEKRVEGYYTQPFCFPRLKYKRERHEYYAGIKCRY